MKKIGKIALGLSMAAMLGIAGGAMGCGTTQEDSTEKGQIYAIYELAVEDGFEGSYQDWLASIKGADGITPTIVNGYWYLGSFNTNVKARGVDGKDGIDGKDGKDGKDASYVKYTVSLDYNGMQEYFKIPESDDLLPYDIEVNSNEWLTTLPDINDSYKDMFCGWFIEGTNKQITNYDFIGGDITLEAKFNSGAYKNGALVKSWDEIKNENSIESTMEKDCNFSNLDADVFVVGEEIKEINGAFSECANFRSIVLQEGLQKIGSGAFKDCTSLTSISIPSSVEIIEAGAFYNCKRLMEVALNEGKIIELDKYAFLGCTMDQTFLIPETTLEQLAETEAILPSSLCYNIHTSFWSGDFRFIGCDDSFVINSITIDYQGCLYYGTEDNPYLVLSILPPDIIDQSLTVLHIPDGVKFIHDMAFRVGDNNVKQMFFGKNSELITIDTYITYDLQLTSIVIPKTAKVILDDFYYSISSSSLEKIYYGGSSISEWNEILFDNADSEKTLNIGNAEIYYYSETQPTGEGNYWHYDNDENVVEW